MTQLLSREVFREKVFVRDSFKCVYCGNQDIVAHHIIDRALWDNGGYFIENGVALCPKCHVLAEQTLLSCVELRKLSNIHTILLPNHLCPEDSYDKWGNILLPSGARIKGELFFNKNLQEILPKNILIDFIPYTKYPKTLHLPWSDNLQNDDRLHHNIEFFKDKEIIATIKLDGENTNMYRDYIHARSINSVHHESRAWIKSLHATIKRDIPEGYRICGENMYAKHSIHYQHLKSYFYVFSIWNEKNEALGWDETVEFCELLNLHPVPVFFKGIVELKELHDIFKKYCSITPDPVEGYVIRIADKIPYSMFKHSLAKYVRANHVQTDEFWMTQPVVPNKLEEGPIYTYDEMRDLRGILLRTDSDLERVAVDTLYITSNLSKNLDCIQFKYELLNLITESDTTLDKYNGSNWSDINEERRLEALLAIKNAMFCDFNKVALNINKPLREISNWRLAHGK
jgi:hypothetical protein